MKLVNGWKAFNKQHDKVNIAIRISSLTIIQLKIDFSNKDFALTLLNFTIKS